jgi:hypothetical protein
VQHSKGGVQDKQTNQFDHLMSEPYGRRLVLLGVQRVGEWRNMIVVVYSICLQAFQSSARSRIVNSEGFNSLTVTWQDLSIKVKLK